MQYDWKYETVYPFPRHPATYNETILDKLRELVPTGLVLDIFGGSGKIGLLGEAWQGISSEIEPEWARQGYGNNCKLCVVADATCLPFRDNSIPAICTSPSYGCRLADSYAPDMTAKSDATRRSYRIYLGRPLRGQNSGGMQWGDSYRKLHKEAWAEAYRVLVPGGMLIVNCKDHVRAGVWQEVCDWHWKTIGDLGFNFSSQHFLPLKGDQNTNRHRAQGRTTVDYEQVVAWSKP